MLPNRDQIGAHEAVAQAILSSARDGSTARTELDQVALLGGGPLVMFSDHQRSRALTNLRSSTSDPQLGQRSELLRRKARHSGIFQAVSALDSQLDEATRQTLARWIADQYAVEYGSILLGMVAVCYLGPPYVDHRLDLLGGIVDHFAASDPMPAPYDSARMLARSGTYAFVEVHSDGSIVPVLDDGSTS